ncbi:TetR/AcrR family transcriptional regulator [Trinickia caryophylli]|uniref:Transcriptional regulator, TetR family n=1 Tax=Trinickia caryophylli TaxID=28094 RepID=A0A1X7G6F6_TRICW|nr:TetR/AcrR family transcriptional regulator [Trinickia caryophylli]WQE14119.1 TetR/AcrR family transcriptional regulator [Trinickia caryophylli]SMF63997.1 transcriptional regulator, TetR family [Trinickia caryophylli]
MDERTPRERLLDAAEALVYAGGIHATGVDAIVRQAAATRKSFYTYFESKDALVTAALERRHERWMKWFVDGTRRGAPTPRAQLLVIFDLLRVWFASPEFHGCAFLNAAGEIGPLDDPVRIVAREHKAQLLAFVQDMWAACLAAQGRDEGEAPVLARQWLILIDGAIGVALVSGSPDAARDAQAAAERLIDAVVPEAKARQTRQSRSRIRMQDRSQS